MEYYIDDNGTFYEKTGIDFRVAHGLQTAHGLRVAGTSEVEAHFKTIDMPVGGETRDGAIESNIVLTGTSAEYQIDAAARANIAVALRKAEANGYPDKEVRDWRLADNSWRETTLGELKQLLNQYDERFESVWYQFNIWDSGDRSEPFEVEL